MFHGHSLTAVFLLVLGALTPAAETTRLLVLHTNDCHGQCGPRKATWMRRQDPPLVGGIGRAAAVVRDERAARGDALLVLDGGDWYAGTPEGAIDAGLEYLKLLSMVGYDAMCVGNHDFDHGIPNLQRILREARLPGIAANLYEKGADARVAWVPGWRIVERAGLKIALVGIVTTVTPEISHPDARTIVFMDPAEALRRARKELEGKVDWILPVTHQGVEEDRLLARAHPDLPLIVGGHSHTFLKEGVREGSVLIVQAGTKLSAIGRVEVEIDPVARKVVSARASLQDLDAEPKEPLAEVEAALRELVARSDERMSIVVGEAAGHFGRSKDPLVSGAAGNLVADCLREHTRADVGIMNRGGLRTDLVAGKLTRRDLYEFLPFDNDVTVVSIEGAVLHELFRRAIEGKSHSGIEVSGAILRARRGAEGNAFLGATVGGSELDRAKTYRVAMHSFMADGGDAYIDKVPLGPGRVDEPLLLRDLLEMRIMARGSLAPDAGDRYEVAP
jgi:2',3'-cyclic-nucleotide 2'-phosphodiesterase (5'-nucleotidase family)